MPAKKKTPDFETSLEALEALVERLESGELTLEASLKEYERGMALVRDCQKILDEAEQRVRLLTGDDELVDFDPATKPGTDEFDDEIPF